MTATLYPMIDSQFSRPRADRAVRADAGSLRDLLRGALDHDVSVALGQRHWDLDRASWEASAPNWDGYDANPVDPEAYSRAKAFLYALPMTAPSPEVGIDPDGEVSFTWQRGPRQVFSVSIRGDGRLSYAGLFGPASTHGTESFVDELPTIVGTNLSRLFPAGA